MGALLDYQYASKHSRLKITLTPREGRIDLTSLRGQKPSPKTPSRPFRCIKSVKNISFCRIFNPFSVGTSAQVLTSLWNHLLAANATTKALNFIYDATLVSCREDSSGLEFPPLIVFCKAQKTGKNIYCFIVRHFFARERRGEKIGFYDEGKQDQKVKLVFLIGRSWAMPEHPRKIWIPL